MDRIKYMLCLLLLPTNSILLSQNLVDISYIENNNSIVFHFKNTSETTLFLFSTYFEQEYITSAYLRQVDKSNEKYLISFLPLVPYLSAYLTDRIVLGEDKIVTEGQNLYSFIKLEPKKDVEVTFSSEDLFGNLNGNKNAVKAFTESDLQEKKFKKVTYNFSKKKYDLVFEFAVYENIDKLCSKSKYINGGNETQKQETSYKIIKVRADLTAFR